MNQLTLGEHNRTSDQSRPVEPTVPVIFVTSPARDGVSDEDQVYAGTQATPRETEQLTQLYSNHANVAAQLPPVPDRRRVEANDKNTQCDSNHHDKDILALTKYEFSETLFNQWLVKHEHYISNIPVNMKYKNLEKNLLPRRNSLCNKNTLNKTSKSNILSKCTVISNGNYNNFNSSYDPERVCEQSKEATNTSLDEQLFRVSAVSSVKEEPSAWVLCQLNTAFMGANSFLEQVQHCRSRSNQECTCVSDDYGNCIGSDVRDPGAELARCTTEDEADNVIKVNSYENLPALKNSIISPINNPLSSYIDSIKNENAKSISVFEAEHLADDQGLNVVNNKGKSLEKTKPLSPVHKQRQFSHDMLAPESKILPQSSVSLCLSGQTAFKLLKKVNEQTTDVMNPIDCSASSTLSVVEEYLYKDEQSGVQLVERRCPALCSTKGTLESLVSHDDKLLLQADANCDKPPQQADVSVLSSVCTAIEALSCSVLHRELVRLGCDPGPVVDSTRRAYGRLLSRIQNGKQRVHS